jgi:ankyrin repeat domain-containing protein 50
MLGSLIKQLCCRRPNTPRSLKDLGRYKEQGQRPDMKTLMDTLAATIHGFSDVFLVIDALDECPFDSGERKKLLDCLRRIHVAKPDNLHLLCTSRREPDIEAVFNPLLSPPSKIALDLSIYRAAVNRDIGLYIDKTLATSDYDSWLESVKVEARATLIENADGM